MNNIRKARMLLIIFVCSFAHAVFSQTSYKELTNVNGILYYVQSSSQNGTQLWRSDGTPQGTYLLKDVLPGQAGFNPEALTNVNGTLYFAANRKEVFSHEGGGSSFELWKSDGTAQGTVKVKDVPLGDLVYGMPENQPIAMINANGTLYFTAENYHSGYALWKSNGSAAGTVKVTDVSLSYQVPGLNNFNLTNIGSTVYFTKAPAFNTDVDELWKTDGTQAGTQLVRSVPAGVTTGGFITKLTPVNSILFFVTYDPATGVELWKTNGTQAGTSLVKDIKPGEASSSPMNLSSINGVLYFSAVGTGNLREFWKSDGTANGTLMVQSSVDPYYITGVNSTIFFADYMGDKTLYKSDGTKGGTVAVVPEKKYGQNDVSFLTNVNGTLYFRFGTLANDTEIWKSDGTEAGTLLVKDINPGASSNVGNSSDAQQLTASGNYLFFTAFDGTSRELWRTDGTASGTIKLSPQEPTCTASGSIFREYWANVGGTAVSAIPLSIVPTSVTELTSFEAPTNVADNYGQRIKGHLCAPATGSYTFYIASDDNSELWLSTDEDPANKVKIASVGGWTNPREWTKFTSQKSATVTLQGGRRYYIEALQKEGVGGDNLAVGWTTPTSATITVIPGSVLSPFVPNNARLAGAEQEHGSLTLSVYPNPSAGEELQVEIGGLQPKQPLKVSLYSSIGTRKLSIDYVADESGHVQKQLLVAGALPAGVYLLKAESGGNTVVKRIVISR